MYSLAIKFTASIRILSLNWMYINFLKYLLIIQYENLYGEQLKCFFSNTCRYSAAIGLQVCSSGDH